MSVPPRRVIQVVAVLALPVAVLVSGWLGGAPAPEPGAQPTASGTAQAPWH